MCSSAWGGIPGARRGEVKCLSINKACCLPSLQCTPSTAAKLALVMHLRSDMCCLKQSEPCRRRTATGCDDGLALQANPNQLAVGANDQYVRMWDRRMLSLGRFSSDREAVQFNRSLPSAMLMGKCYMVVLDTAHVQAPVTGMAAVLSR